MNITKSVIVIAAMLVTATGMAGIANYSNAAADSARHAIRASTQQIRTLPAINVSPTREQLRELRNGSRKADSTTPASADARMPYYSFASGETGA